MTRFAITAQLKAYLRSRANLSTRRLDGRRIPAGCTRLAEFAEPLAADAFRGQINPRPAAKAKNRDAAHCGVLLLSTAPRHQGKTCAGVTVFPSEQAVSGSIPIGLAIR